MYVRYAVYPAVYRMYVYLYYLYSSCAENILGRPMLCPCRMLARSYASYLCVFWCAGVHTVGEGWVRVRVTQWRCAGWVRVRVTQWKWAGGNRPSSISLSV